MDLGDWIAGIFIGCLIAVALFMMGFICGTSDGYEKAYVDLKQNKIEKVMKTRHANVWVKYNALNEEEKGSE